MTVIIDHIIQLNTAITGTRPAITNAGHPLDQAPRPYWQDQPCPSWCMRTAPHQDDDMRDDRYHRSVIHHINLTLADASVTRSGAGELLSCVPAFLTAQLHQHYRDRDPQAVLTINGKAGIPFTTAEAGKLARALAALAGKASARDAKPRGKRSQCPPWCTVREHREPFIGDRHHVSAYRMVPLSLADPEFWYPPESGAGERPEPEVELRLIGTNLWQGWREREALVSIVYRDDYTDLTLGEARELAEALSGLVADAKPCGDLAAAV